MSFRPESLYRNCTAREEFWLRVAEECRKVGFRVYTGTSAFTATGWEGSFYPQGTKPADFLRYYAQHFNSVEVDSTFYRIPSLSTVRGWYEKTPKSFIFAAKIPQVLTHEKVLVDCEAEFKQFMEVMDTLGEKLGPLLFQFGYFNKKAFVGVNDFLARLRPFLKKLLNGDKFAVEIRNKNWLVPQFIEALRERGVALALVDQGWMPRPALAESCRNPPLPAHVRQLTIAVSPIAAVSGSEKRRWPGRKMAT